MIDINECSIFKNNSMLLKVSRDVSLRGTQILIQGTKEGEVLVFVSDTGKASIMRGE